MPTDFQVQHTAFMRKLWASGARSLAQVKGPDGGTLEFVACKAGVAIIQTYKDGIGCDVFPQMREGKWDATLEKLGTWTV